jgi:hypothetical protein
MDNTTVDDQKRGPDGVVCSIRSLSDGKLRIVLDDVDNTNSPNKGPWRHRVLVTWKDYDLEELKALESLPEKELAAFGHYVLARLVAIHETGT